jgi:acetyltransferase-like isoleucine patch superfamily enzyme
MGRNVTIRDNNGGHYLSMQGYKESQPVKIGNHVWLCEGCTIMPGAKIGDGAIVGAGSVVYGHVPPYSLVSGNPAKVVQTNTYWKY